MSRKRRKNGPTEEQIRGTNEVKTKKCAPALRQHLLLLKLQSIVINFVLPPLTPIRVGFEVDL